MAGNHYDQLGAASRAAHHSHEVLKYAEYPEPRARIGNRLVAIDWLERAESSEMKEQLQQSIAEVRAELDGHHGP